MDNWTALFRPGERVRLRFVNAAAMTTFNVRLPGLRLEIVAADGLPVRPVTVDEFQIGVAETYDAIVIPRENRAYTLIGEAVDRSGLARCTLVPREGMAEPMPRPRPRPRPRPLATMRDMGMGMTGMEMDMSMRDPRNAPTVPLNPGVQTISPMAADRMGESGQGLANAGHRVLTYEDLVAATPNPDPRAPDRALTIHLTGNMERYIWSFDGEKYSEVNAPIPFLKDERVRVTLVNDTMTGRPIHPHGHFFELVTGHGDHSPRKHTVLVQPGGTATFDVTTDAVGDWAFHCHMFHHMHAGMMRTVSVRSTDNAA